MIPIVFWASFAPCIRLNAAAETSWKRRNHLSTRLGGIHRNSQKIDTIRRKPTVSPMKGATTMKMSVFVQPEGMIAMKPALATAAPAYPPKSACEELVGRPAYQVKRFHAIAPIIPAKITASVTTLRSTMPLPTVLATAVPTRNAAAKLKNAAQITALPGESTRVETTVAIEFAASWKPLM